MTADSSILRRNADGPVSKQKQCFRLKNDGFARKELETLLYVV